MIVESLVHWKKLNTVIGREEVLVIVLIWGWTKRLRCLPELVKLLAVSERHH